MAKMRGYKPDFWTDERVVSVSPLARLLFLGMWNYCCDNGHLDPSPVQLKMRVLPVDNCDVSALVDELVASGLVNREADHLVVPNLAKHQRIDKRFFLKCEYCSQETPESSHIPEDTAGKAATHASARREPAVLTPSSHDEVRGSEVRGSEKKKEGGDKSPATPSKKGTRLPEGWMPDQAVREAMAAEFPHVDFRAEHAKFTDHWAAASGANATKKDWNAAWRNWIRRSVEFGQQRGGPRAPADPRLARDYTPPTCQRCTGLLHPTEVRAGHDRCETCRVAA